MPEAVIACASVAVAQDLIGLDYLLEFLGCSFMMIMIRMVLKGELSEGFVERLSPGDVFVLGGKAYEFSKARGMSLFVKPATGRRPTIPSWTGEMLPRSFDLSVAIGQFRGQVGELAASGTDTEKWLLKNYPLDRGGARSISS